MSSTLLSQHLFGWNLGNRSYILGVVDRYLEFGDEKFYFAFQVVSLCK